MLLLDVSWTGCLVRKSNEGWLGRRAGLLDGFRLRVRSRVMAGGRLWPGSLGILAAGSLRVQLGHGLLRDDSCGERHKEERKGDKGEAARAPDATGMMRIGFHVLLSEPDGPPEDQLAFHAAGGVVHDSTEVRATSVDPVWGG
jgi:hypothetical protein